MKMRQPLSHFERAFEQETALDRDRRESLRRTAERRAARRRSQRAIRQGKSRFLLLSLTLLATAAIVAYVMFRVLYLIAE
jgi:Flp pilus assembly protein TadB